MYLCSLLCFAVLICFVQVLSLSVPALRRYWALLLQHCADKHTQEHPLYALFSSILSTLSKAISISGSHISPASTDSVIFSYPQCRVVDLEYGSMSVYPDFGLIHLTTMSSPNGKTKVEWARLLIEIKRRQYFSEGEKLCIYPMTNLQILGYSSANEPTEPAEMLMHMNIRQLLLQAYCTFSVYKQHEVSIMFVPGVHFTLLKFKRPNPFNPLAQAPTAPNKKRKLEAEESSAGEHKY